MNKKGQFYLIIALVLALVIYGITYQSNSIQESPTFEDFNDLSQNYLTESKKITNQALENEESPITPLESFTKSFLTYAKSREPNLDLLYIYSDKDGRIIVRNYLSEEVQSGDDVVLGSNEKIIQEITVNVGGKSYTYQVPVSLGEFGQEWYTGEVPTGAPINLGIGGINHNFNLSKDAANFEVIIRTKDDEYTVVCQGGYCQRT